MRLNSYDLKRRAENAQFCRPYSREDFQCLILEAMREGVNLARQGVEECRVESEFSTIPIYDVNEVDAKLREAMQEIDIALLPLRMAKQKVTVGAK